MCLPSPDSEVWPFPVFNPVQSAALKILQANSRANLIVSTGTGTGKTVCAELALLQITAAQHAIVMEPLKALAHEKVKDWTKRFPHLSFVEMTSDADLGFGRERNKALEAYNVIVCSYEMLDSMTRKPDIYTVLRSVSLLVVDEVHELGDESRGGPLDGALTRFLMTHKPQIVALSATFDNVEDLRSYLEQFVGKVEVVSLPFAPIKVNVTPEVVAYPQRGREGVMVQEVSKLLASTKGGILAMCLSIPSVDIITSELNAQHGNGTAVAHYSEMSAEDRHDVEDLYRSKGARVIVSTPTLLAGVNIPAQSIVLDVSYFDQDSYRTAVLPATKIRQAVGRAGRLPWYKEGFVTYVCQSTVLQQAKEELAKPMVVRGTLFATADATLNTEVQLIGTLTSRTLLEWYRRTFSRFSNRLDERTVEETFSRELNWLHDSGYLKIEDRVTGRVRGTFKGKTAHEHFLQPRWLSEAEAFLQAEPPLDYNNLTSPYMIAADMLDYLAILSASKHCPFTWSDRKRNATLKLMGCEQMLDGGTINWSVRDQNYQWVRDLADNLGRLTTALTRIGCKAGGLQTLELLGTCYARGGVSPQLARLSSCSVPLGSRVLGTNVCSSYTGTVCPRVL